MTARLSKGENDFSPEGEDSTDIQAPLAGSAWLKFFWPGAVLLLFIIATVFAFNQSPRPDPWQPVKQYSADWLLHPVETNAFKRLPLISGGLQSVFSLPDSNEVWAAGRGGLILHSHDSGLHWKQQNPPIPQQKVPPKKADNGFIPNVYAMDAGYSDVQAQQVQQVQPARKQLRPNNLLKQNKPDVRKKIPVGKSQRSTKKAIDQSKLVQQKQVPAQTDAGVKMKDEQLRLSANLSDIYFVDSKRGWAVGESGTILATSDGGKSWQPQASGTNASLKSVTFDSSGKGGWAVGDSGTIIATSDGGKSWQPRASGTNAGLTSVTFDSSSKGGWAVGKSGTIRATSDGGKSWRPQASGMNAGLTSVTFDSSGKSGWAVGVRGTILTTSDGGKSWQPQASGTNAGLTSVTFDSSGKRGWVAGDRGTILATSDGGKSWQPQASGTNAGLTSVTLDSSGKSGWAVGIGGAILVTSDGGKSWQPQASGTNAGPTSVMLDSSGKGGRAVGVSGTILATSDGRKSWQSGLEPYSISPAPWYLPSAIFCLVLLGYLLRRLIPEILGSAPERKKTIINKSVSDRPAGPGSPDYLGALKVARGLARFISNRHTTPPVTLAITGDWGSGKSSVMNYLCAQLRRDGLKTVWFNAWHHREEGNVLASMLENVRRQAIPRTPYGLYIRLRLLLKRHWIFKLASVALLFGVSYISVNIFSHAEKQDAAWHYALYTIGVEQPVALSKKSIETFCKHEADATECRSKLLKIKWDPSRKNTPESNGENRFPTNTKLLEKMKQLLQREFSQEDEKAVLKAAIHPSPELPFAISSTLVSFIGTLLGLIALLIVKGASIVGVGTTGILQKILRMAGFERSKEQVGTRQLFERQFRQITELFGKRRLVIFIDDLDRCEKDYTMKVLETTNFLASSGELFMVIGMAPRYVLANVNLHFTALAEAVHEVEKDNNHAAGEASPSRASFARRYLQKLINIEVPVPKGDKDSTRDMLLGNAGEEDAEGQLEMQRLRLFSHAWKYVWFGIMVGTVALAWHFASYQNDVYQASSQQQHQTSSEQAPRETRQQSRGANNQAEQSGEISSTNSVAQLTPADPEQHNLIPIVIPSILIVVMLLLLFLIWRYRDKREKLIAMFKPLGIAITGPQQTEDSEDFSAALEIWNDVIFHANPNPRKIKVFLNHLRYVSSQMIDESGGHEAHLVGIAVMHYVFGKDIESLARKNLMAAETYQKLCNSEVADRIGTSWSNHREKFHMLPNENDWDSYLKFIRNVVIHQPHHQAD